ncbi:hypothetical protein DJ81_08670 [Halorubrum sp. Hd13]|nr:hypothetical protein DJ81_08670 [Halorubrum sp. Hd13]
MATSENDSKDTITVYQERLDALDATLASKMDRWSCRFWNDNRVGSRRISLNSRWRIGSSARLRACESYLYEEDLELFRTASETAG